MTRLIYVHGTGGHGRAVTGAALDAGFQVIQTDDADGTEPPHGADCIICIGDNRIRKAHDRPNMKSVVHPSASVSTGAVVACGSYIGPHAVVISGTRIGRGAIINTNATIEHDCMLGAWVHVAPGAVLCGTVALGEGVFIGANAVVRQGVSIAPWVVVGCGAVVIENITEPGTYVGNPVHKIAS